MFYFILFQTLCIPEESMMHPDFNKWMFQFQIPPGFQEILYQFTKAVLKNQPKDIIAFADMYFSTIVRNRDQALSGKFSDLQ